MTKYYHLTDRKNLKSILEKGLVPQNGDKSKACRDEKSAVCFSKDEVFTIIMYFSFLFFYEETAGSWSLYNLREYLGEVEAYNSGPEDNPNFSKERLMDLKKKIEQIRYMQRYKSFSEFMGDLIYLEVSDIDVCAKEKHYHDCFTEEVIPPDIISVPVLKSRKNGRLVTDYKKILFYLFGMTGIDAIKKVYRENYQDIFDEDSLEETLNEYYMYYNLNQSFIERLQSEYDLIYMSLKEYLSLEEAYIPESGGRK